LCALRRPAEAGGRDRPRAGPFWLGSSLALRTSQPDWPELTEALYPLAGRPSKLKLQYEAYSSLPCSPAEFTQLQFLLHKLSMPWLSRCHLVNVCCDGRLAVNLFQRSDRMTCAVPHNARPVHVVRECAVVATSTFQHSKAADPRALPRSRETGITPDWTEISAMVGQNTLPVHESRPLTFVSDAGFMRQMPSGDSQLTAIIAPRDQECLKRVRHLRAVLLIFSQEASACCYIRQPLVPESSAKRTCLLAKFANEMVPIRMANAAKSSQLYVHEFFLAERVHHPRKSSSRIPR
jgi:hypothetical protein